MRVCVIGGAGYVGLVTGLGLAEIGHNVVNVDVNRDRMDSLQSGHATIHEEGIQDLLQRCVSSGVIRFSSELPDVVRQSDVIFIAVGTPSLADGQPDLSQVIEVSEQIAQHLNSYKLVAIKSTVPVGTVELVRRVLSRDKREGDDFDIVSNPEFLREGKALYDFFHPDRIVVGASSDHARALMRALYEPIISRNVSWPAAANSSAEAVPVVETDVASAQMIKYASNTFLATRISLMNEISGLCERVGADIKEVAAGIGHDPRIGHRYLEAGLGFGGPCLEKDLRALIKIAENNDYEPYLLRAVLQRNDRQTLGVISKLKEMTGYLLYKKIITVLGLSFKPGTSDVRNSLALRIVAELGKEGATVRAHDPLAIPEAMALQPNVEYYEDPYEATRNADALLILTEWPEYRTLDYGRIKSEMGSPILLDSRNLLDPGQLRSLGFTYYGIGRS